MSEAYSLVCKVLAIFKMKISRGEAKKDYMDGTVRSMPVYSGKSNRPEMLSGGRKNMY